MNFSRCTFISILLIIIPVFALSAGEKISKKQQSATLTRAVMCGSIKDLEPKDPAVVFPISLGKVYCFTSFDPVHKRSHVRHKWYQRDRLISNKKLTLKPPKWSTSSSMELRMADRGPWRLVVVDDKDNIIRVLRFSISD